MPGGRAAWPTTHGFAQAWLGELPDDVDGLPHIPVRLHARSWHRYPEPSPSATAIVMYTSGTTGLPKGVLISRQAVAADIDALEARLDAEIKAAVAEALTSNLPR